MIVTVPTPVAVRPLTILFLPVPWAASFHKSRHDVVPDSGNDRQITALWQAWV